MAKLNVQTFVLAESARGPILEVRISGRVESRIDGIASRVGASLSESSAAGVVFNFTKLVFGSWDDIGIHGVIAATEGITRPCCILSTGRNRKSLNLLMEITKIGKLLGGEIFGNTDAAVEYIRKSLEKGPI